MVGQISYRIPKDTAADHLYLDQFVVILHYIVPIWVLLIYNSWFRMKGVQSTGEHELPRKGAVAVSGSGVSEVERSSEW
jgi:hypothetical protein